MSGTTGDTAIQIARNLKPIVAVVLAVHYAISKLTPDPKPRGECPSLPTRRQNLLGSRTENRSRRAHTSFLGAQAHEECLRSRPSLGGGLTGSHAPRAKDCTEICLL